MLKFVICIVLCSIFGFNEQATNKTIHFQLSDFDFKKFPDLF